MYWYKIGDVQFGLPDNSGCLKKDEFTDLFSICEEELKKDNVTIEYEHYLLQTEHLEEFRLIKKNGMYELFETPKGFLLVYHWAKCRFAFAYWVEDLKSKGVVPVYFNPDLYEQIPLSVVRFFSCAGMHSKLLQYSAMILHSSYIVWREQGILFTAPSQTGKSTQAELWKCHAGAEIINGDRALIRKRGGLWHSFGYPCCGSSKICINKTVPLRVIVVLEQGKENRVVEMSFGEKVCALVSGAEMFPWSSYEMERIFSLAEAIAGEVAIVKLICKPDEDAVRVMKAYLEEW